MSWLRGCGCRYVSRKDCKKNVVFISRQYFTPERRRDAFRCGMFNWISGSPPWQHGQQQRLTCKVRHPQLQCAEVQAAKPVSETCPEGHNFAAGATRSSALQLSRAL